ncbi:GTPase-activating protein, putative [Sugiyamaella lignohabitans]|uniref:GTPase-activating protein, putative n=1 Tax=Sugiyamaella lignohabitans TaxID=796027 RepID=A0A167EQP2_9ASCO|nr:GTPase-activating protein, putative [Sugiyamaella lignohabitans]ANB14355.1 GTPase-activating protein, putative [Sugiyamaella lignohabitans]
MSASTSPSMRMPAAFRALALSSSPQQSGLESQEPSGNGSNGLLKRGDKLNNDDPLSPNLNQKPTSISNEIISNSDLADADGAENSTVDGEDDELTAPSTPRTTVDYDLSTKSLSTPIAPPLRHTFSSPSLTVANGTSPSSTRKVPTSNKDDNHDSSANIELADDEPAGVSDSIKNESANGTADTNANIRLDNNSNDNTNTEHNLTSQAQDSDTHAFITTEPGSLMDEKYLLSERDRYGFKKTMGFKSVEEYNAWWKKYRLHLIRRKKKWDKLIGDNGGYLPPSETDGGVPVPSRFPSRSDTGKCYGV